MYWFASYLSAEAAGSVRHDQKTTPLMKRWTNHAITLLLLSALIVAGISVYYTRQEWREMYMRVMKHRWQ